MPTPSSPSINREWYFLIKTSVLFSFLCVLTIVFSIISFFLWPPFPESIVDIMVSDVFSGIMSLDVLYLIAVLFTLPLVVCLFVLFRESHYSMALFALVIGLIGIVLVVFCRPILEMVTLCREYSRAANEFEKSLFL